MVFRGISARRSGTHRKWSRSCMSARAGDGSPLHASPRTCTAGTPSPDSLATRFAAEAIWSRHLQRLAEEVQGAAEIDKRGQARCADRGPRDPVAPHARPTLSLTTPARRHPKRASRARWSAAAFASGSRGSGIISSADASPPAVSSSTTSSSIFMPFPGSPTPECPTCERSTPTLAMTYPLRCSVISTPWLWATTSFDFPSIFDIEPSSPFIL